MTAGVYLFVVEQNNWKSYAWILMNLEEKVTDVFKAKGPIDTTGVSHSMCLVEVCALPGFSVSALPPAPPHHSSPSSFFHFHDLHFVSTSLLLLQKCRQIPQMRFPNPARGGK